MRPRPARHIVVCMAMSLLLVSSCGDGDLVATAEDPSSGTRDQGSFGSDVPVDLAVYFHEGVTDEQLTNFILEVLSKPQESGRKGQPHLDGVQYTSGDYTRSAVYVTFFPEATSAQREAVADAIRSSPLVERIATDITPSEMPTD